MFDYRNEVPAYVGQEKAGIGGYSRLPEFGYNRTTMETCKKVMWIDILVLLQVVVRYPEKSHGQDTVITQKESDLKHQHGLLLTDKYVASFDPPDDLILFDRSTAFVLHFRCYVLTPISKKLSMKNAKSSTE